MGAAPAQPRSGLAITALGACTSLGGIEQAAAAFRAGVTRARQLALDDTLDPDTNEAAVVSAHPVSGVTDGFEGMGRHVRLATLALREIMDARPDLARAKTMLLLGLPSEDQDAPPQSLTGSTAATLMRHGDDTIAARVARIEGLRLTPTGAGEAAGGRSVAAFLVSEAFKAIEGGRVDAVIVGAVDSELDPPRLLRSLDQRRLKTLQNPVGFMPGEAAALLLLERQRNDRPHAPLAELWPAASAAEPSPTSTSDVASGRGLQAVIMGGVANLGAAGTRPGMLYLDLNGETYRASDWGTAVVRLGTSSPVAAWQQRIPAIAFGDTGAAAPFLAACLAIRAFVSEPAAPSSALALTTADDGARIAIPLTRANERPQHPDR